MKTFSGDELRAVINQLCMDSPGLRVRTSTQEERESLINEITNKLLAVYASPENAISLILELLTAKYDLEVQKRNSIVVPYVLKELRITIHDHETEEDRQKPRAVITGYDNDPNFDDYWNFTFSKEIDILSFIEQDPINIRHPAILTAIKRWQLIIQVYGRASARSGRVEVKPKDNNTYERANSQKVVIYKIAKTHLENIGKAIVTGAHKEMISPAVLYYVFQQHYDPQRKEFLLLAWEILGLKEVTKKERNEEKFKLLKQKLEPLIRQKYNEEQKERESLQRYFEDIGMGSQLPPSFLESEYIRLITGPVLGFFRSPEGIPFLSDRKQRRNILPAFTAWMLGVDVGTLQKYRGKARRELKSEQVTKVVSDYRNFNPSFSTYHIGRIIDWENPLTWFIPDFRRK